MKYKNYIWIVFIFIAVITITILSIVYNKIKRKIEGFDNSPGVTIKSIDKKIRVAYFIYNNDYSENILDGLYAYDEQQNFIFENIRYLSSFDNVKYPYYSVLFWDYSYDNFGVISNFIKSGGNVVTRPRNLLEDDAKLKDQTIYSNNFLIVSNNDHPIISDDINFKHLEDVYVGGFKPKDDKSISIIAKSTKSLPLIGISTKNSSRIVEFAIDNRIEKKSIGKIHQKLLARCILWAAGRLENTKNIPKQIDDKIDGSNLLTPIMVKNIFNSSKNIKLLYKATRDGYDTFPRKFPIKGPTLTVALTDNDEIIGGYLPESWKNDGTLTDPTREAFIYNYNNGDVKKYKILDTYSAATLFRGLLPQFGDSDLVLVDPSYEGTEGRSSATLKSYGNLYDNGKRLVNNKNIIYISEIEIFTVE
jgi:hypothetical protein